MSEQETKTQEPQPTTEQSETKETKEQQTEKKTSEEPDYISTGDFAKTVISNLRKIKSEATSGFSQSVQLANTMDSVESWFMQYSEVFFVIPTMFVNLSRLYSVKMASSSVSAQENSEPGVFSKAGYAGVVVGLAAVAAGVTTAKYLIHSDEKNSQDEGEGGNQKESEMEALFYNEH